MAKAVILSDETLAQAVQSRAVRNGLDDVADAMLARARGLANSVGANAFAAALTRTDGVRPGTKAQGGYRRPYARVQAATEGAEAVEHGDVGVTRQSILARAAGGKR